MSETIATVGVFLTEDERKHLVRLCEELEALEESALRNNEVMASRDRAAERAALRKLMFLPITPSPAKYNALGNGDLTPEQLEGMEMWDCDEMLDRRHRAVGSYLVKRAVAEIRRRRATDRAALPDETRQVIATIINHKDSIGAWLEAAALRTLLAVADGGVSLNHGAERVRAVVREAVRALAGMGHWPPPMELCEAIADRVVSQLALSSVALGSSAIPPLLDDADHETLEWLKSLASAGILVHQIDGISQQHTDNCRKAVALIERLQGKP